jgi:hypothetical protein
MLADVSTNTVMANFLPARLAHGSASDTIKTANTAHFRIRNARYAPGVFRSQTYITGSKSSSTRKMGRSNVIESPNL